MTSLRKAPTVRRRGLKAWLSRAKRVERVRQPGRYGDGKGLYLQVSKAGVRSWVLRYERDGRERWMGLGPVGDFTLDEARERARKERQKLADGIDPIDACDQGVRSARRGEAWLSSREILGRRDRRPPAVCASASRRCSTGRPCVSTDSGDNPARLTGNLEHALAKRDKLVKVEHHPALPYRDLSAFMAELRQREGVAAQALEFTISTAARTGETIGARWDEIDLDRATWVIPAQRMQAQAEHRVPLSDRAVALLNSLYRERDNPFVFIGTQPGSGLSNMAMAAVLHRMGRDYITVHGFRSTFRDWAAETTAFPNHVVEMALAHKIGDKVEAAYRRGDLFDKRRKLMGRLVAYLSRRSSRRMATSCRCVVGDDPAISKLLRR